MREPKIEDFNLDENSFKQFEIQQAKYDEECEKHRKKIDETKQHNVTALKIAFIPVIIAFCICGLVQISSESQNATPGILVFIGSIVYVVFVLLSGYQNTDKLPAPERFKFIDEQLEKRITDYEHAVYEHNKAVERARYEREQAEIMKHRHYWERMNGYEFEKAVAELYELLGYKAKLTPKSGDGGVDVILTKDNQRIAVQCKHHQKPVAPNDYRALVGCVAAKNFDSGIFVSLRGFTSGVTEENAGNKRIPIKLIELNDLIRIGRELWASKQNTNGTLPTENNVKTKQNTVGTSSIKTNEKTKQIAARTIKIPPLPQTTRTTEKNNTFVKPMVLPPIVNKSSTTENKGSQTTVLKSSAAEGVFAEIEINGIKKTGKIIKIEDRLEGKIATIQINEQGHTSTVQRLFSAIKINIKKTS